MKILNTIEVARLLNCHPQMVRELVHRGEIQKLRGTGRSIFLFDADQVSILPKVKRGRPRKIKGPRPSADLTK